VVAPADAASVAVAFNDRITAHDAEALSRLMTDDHEFVDTAGRSVSGRPACRAAWAGFFAAFPDYRNVLTVVTAHGERIAIAGYSICAEPDLAGPALWGATVRSGQVARWQVYDDTPGNRRVLGLPGGAGDQT
jgi:ketosteroid isomerase-like protein